MAPEVFLLAAAVGRRGPAASAMFHNSVMSNDQLLHITRKLERRVFVLKAAQTTFQHGCNLFWRTAACSKQTPLVSAEKGLGRGRS
jgi:hypothetical protein